MRTLFEKASDIRAAQREKIWRRGLEKGRAEGRQEIQQEIRQIQQLQSQIRALLRDAPRGRDPETGAPTITISRELRAELLDLLEDGDA